MMAKMRPRILMLGDYCINCSVPLGPNAVREITLDLNFDQGFSVSSPIFLETISVNTVCKSIYRLDYLSLFDSNFGGQKPLGVCSKCGNILKKMYMNQKELTNARSGTSYLGKKIDELHLKLHELQMKIREFQNNNNLSVPGHHHQDSKVATMTEDEFVLCPDENINRSMMDNRVLTNLIEDETMRRQKKLTQLARFKQLRCAKDDPLSTIIDDHDYLRNNLNDHEDTTESHGGGDDFYDHEISQNTPIAAEEVVIEQPEQDAENERSSVAMQPPAMPDDQNDEDINPNEQNRGQPVIHYLGDEYDLLQVSLPQQQFNPPAASQTSTESETSSAKSAEVFLCECDTRFKKKKSFEAHRKMCSLRKKAVIVFRLGAKRHQQQTVDVQKLQPSSTTATLDEDAVIDSAFARNQGQVQPKIVNGPLNMTQFCDPGHRFYCHLCKESWENNGADFFSHLMKNHSCQICPVCTHLFFLNNSDWKEHVTTAHPNGCTLFVCLNCGTACANNTEMRVHTAQCFKCREPSCQKIFKSQASSNHHFKMVHEIQSENELKCPNCDHQSMTKDNLQLHVLQVHGTKKYPCTHANCLGSFALEADLNRHLLTHKQPPLPLPPQNRGHAYCMFCGLHFTWRCTMITHIRLKHTDFSEFKCPEDNCSQKFTRPIELIRHQKAQHFKGYKCKECDKIFPRSYLLRNHMVKVHIDQLKTVHRCSRSHCSRIFATEGDLERHMNTCRGREVRFSCDQCEKSFYWKHHLTKHKLRHFNSKRFQCCKCEKRYSSKYHLNVHEATHSEEKRFACTVDGCTGRFYSNHALNRHQEAHEERSLCTICGYSCKSKGKFKIHLRKHDNNADEEAPEIISPPKAKSSSKKAKARDTVSPPPPPAKKKKVPVSSTHRSPENQEKYIRKVRFHAPTKKMKRYKYYE